MENMDCKLYEKQAKRYIQELQNISDNGLVSGSFAFITKTKSAGLEKCIYCKKTIPVGESVIGLKSLVRHEIERDTRSTISPSNSTFCTACFGEIAVKLSLEEDVKCPNIIINNNNLPTGGEIERVQKIILESCEDKEYNDYMQEKERQKQISSMGYSKGGDFEPYDFIPPIVVISLIIILAIAFLYILK